MKSFIGRDILSLKEFERDDYYRVFEVCDRLAPHARNRRGGPALPAFRRTAGSTQLAAED